MNVALRFNGSRAWTVTDALDAVGISYEVNPENMRRFDIVVIDSPGLVVSTVAKNGRTPTVLRLRGNVWKERKQSGGYGIRGWVSDHVLARTLAGIIATDDRLEGLARRQTGIPATGVAALPIDLESWPSVRHTDKVLRCVTLTNFDYREKIEPLEYYAPWINSLFHRIDGHWTVCGDGEYSGRFADSVAELENVNYEGYVDPKEYLPRMNVMLHLSNFDGERPNAMLEGVASNLPIVTNGFEAFDTNGIAISHDDWKSMKRTLLALREPEARKGATETARHYVKRHHSPAIVGEQYADFFAEVA